MHEASNFAQEAEEQQGGKVFQGKCGREVFQEARCVRSIILVFFLRRNQRRNVLAEP